MKRIIFIALTTILLISSSCKKCYLCTNRCIIQVSRQQYICNTDFSTSEEYEYVVDSLEMMNDAQSGHQTFKWLFNYSKQVCGEEALVQQEEIIGVACSSN